MLLQLQFNGSSSRDYCKNSSVGYCNNSWISVVQEAIATATGPRHIDEEQH